jgi:hypothetical protein
LEVIGHYERKPAHNSGLVQGGPFYSYECKAFQNPTLHQPAKRYVSASTDTTQININKNELHEKIIFDINLCITDNENLRSKLGASFF